MADTLKDGIVELTIGDITTQDVDAIVNAANQSLSGGGGVDGAIHRAAGNKELSEACREIGGCPTGEARITPGFRLLAKWIVHTAGPRYRDGSKGEAGLLASSYQNSIALAHQQGARSIAFPSISTGIYNYPVNEAARIALAELRKGRERFPDLTLLRMVCYSQETYDAYAAAWDD